MLECTALKKHPKNRPHFMSEKINTKPFILHSDFQPSGDQPQAIEKLAENLTDGLAHQTLLGVTGSGKTFTIANVIA